ncbi:Epsin 2 [Aphelenchoides besseyi]|nr:Epsin 2 [Aphelenchoides besseyi]KAI6201479.1 Epsin 2 [Aphelenchoides besseyi]
MSISTLRRQVKNVAYNFSDAQVKVREATSNDPWGPTTALMSEIADLTHNPMSFTEIMSMVWKRLNDHGKNWRHVYKSLVLLDYLIKCGSEKVAQQCRENIYSIETLKDFQHIEENRDQGLNVREKAKQMCSLLTDEERLKNERARFLMTRKRFMQNGGGISSDGTVRHHRKHDVSAVIDSELEEARPSSIGEEEMQLQIALALSREECEKEEELRKGDAIRLQMAMEESKKVVHEDPVAKTVTGAPLTQSALDDLLSLNLGGEPVQVAGPSGLGTSTATNDPWGSGTVVQNDPWSPVKKPEVDPLEALLGSGPVESNNTNFGNDPWAPAVPKTAPVAAALPQNDPWMVFDNTVSTPDTPGSNNGFATLNNAGLIDGNGVTNGIQGAQRSSAKTPESFLGENSSLVNLDNLMGPSSVQAKPANNPFVIGTSLTNNSAPTNPFNAQNRPSPSLNEMMQAQRTGSSLGGNATPNPSTNPFML